MSTGMLWYDGSDREPVLKLEDAVKGYQDKYGVRPFRAIVGVKRGSDKDGKLILFDGIEVEFTHRVSQCHITLWGEPLEKKVPDYVPKPYDRGSSAGTAHTRFHDWGK